MKIGQLAELTGTPVETIRFYEREKLLPHAPRTGSNYRIYGNMHAERLVFIRHCRSLDMALDEIRALLRFKEAPEENCAGVNALLDDHIGHVARRIRELRTLEKQLKALRSECAQAAEAGQCGILKELSMELPGSPAVRKHSAHVHGTH